MDNFNIKEEKENLLFNRKEIYAEIQAKAVPSHTEIEKLISEKFSVPVENIKIKKIQGRFGSNIFTLIFFIYKSKEDKDSTEPKSKKAVVQKV